ACSPIEEREIQPKLRTGRRADQYFPTVLPTAFTLRGEARSQLPPMAAKTGSFTTQKRPEITPMPAGACVLKPSRGSLTAIRTSACPFLRVLWRRSKDSKYVSPFAKRYT